MNATKLGWVPALRRMRVPALLPTLSVLLLGACQVATDPHGRTVVSTLTLGQVLGVAPRPAAYSRVPYATPTAAGAERDRRVVAGRTVEVVAAGTAHRIVVDGQVLATDADDDRVAIQGVYQGGGRTYVLLEEQSGGNACPSMYQAIDLSGGAPAISPQFGNCSDLRRASVGNGALRIFVPAFRAVPARATPSGQAASPAWALQANSAWCSPPLRDLGRAAVRRLPNPGVARSVAAES